MTLPSSGQISLNQIANEFGFTNSPETRLGSYRTTNGQGNFPVSFGALQFNSIDAQTGGSVPTSGQIKFSDFYSTQLQQVVNFYGSGKGGFRLIGRDRYDNNDVNVVGNYRVRPSSSSGTKVHIHVNQDIGSEKFDPDHCALRTGSWNSSTTLQVDVGGSGRIIGAGGEGGDGHNGPGNGEAGQPGSSGLGVQYNPTTVKVASGGLISAGFGGGGGGGGAFDYDRKSSRWSSGGGGGGGTGLPLGEGGEGGTQGTNGGDGSDATSMTEAGEGGAGGNNANEAVSGPGGEGGKFGDPAEQGGTGEGGEFSPSPGGVGGADGAAIRRISGFTVNIDSASLNRIEGTTTATGVQ